jgi:hypothetical protein
MVSGWMMSEKTLLIELLLAGFFAICCIRVHEPVIPGHAVTFTELFRFVGRVERLRRTRWQWFSMVAFMLVLRLQVQLPPILELMVLLEFALFMVLPGRAKAIAGVRDR